LDHDFTWYFSIDFILNIKTITHTYNGGSNLKPYMYTALIE